MNLSLPKKIMMKYNHVMSQFGMTDHLWSDHDIDVKVNVKSFSQLIPYVTFYPS